MVLVCAQALIPASAAALPAGAYWYTALDLQHAWKITKGSGVTVAVIDSGVKASIADLEGRVLPGLDLSGDDPSAHSDTAVHGEGNYGHGTAMAALIAGSGRRGLTGVAPQAKILPVDADHSGEQNQLSSDSTDQGIRWAVDHHADIINLSLGRVEPCTAGDAAAVKYAYDHNVIVVAASGDNGSTVSTPANCPGALAVGAIDAKFAPWSGSNSGSELDFVAPGVNMIDELLDGSAARPGDATSNGTSSAAALVSGTFALLRAKFPNDSPRQLVTRALYNVHNGLGDGQQGKRANDQLGYGLILPKFALTAAPPANAANPIYDRFAKQLGSAGSPSTSTTSPTTTPPTDATSSAGTPGGSSSGAGSPAAAAGSKDSSGFPIWIVIVVVVVVAAVVVAFVVVRGRRNRPRYGGPPPPGWGGPPGPGAPPGGWT